jgi:hypothetical protein
MNVSCVRTASCLDLTLQLTEGVVLQAHHWPIVWGYLFGLLGRLPPLTPTSWVCIPTDMPEVAARFRLEGAYVLEREQLRTHTRLRPLFDGLGVEQVRIRVYPSTPADRPVP